MPNAELTERIKAEAGNCGFQLVGVCPAISPTGFSRFCEWLSSGYAGEMTYLHERQSAYEHPGSVLQGVRSVVMLGMHYGTTRPTPAPPGHGLVSRYAWGEVDYHDLIHSRLKQLKATITFEAPVSLGAVTCKRPHFHPAAPFTVEPNRVYTITVGAVFPDGTSGRQDTSLLIKVDPLDDSSPWPEFIRIPLRAKVVPKGQMPAASQGGNTGEK